MIIIIIIVIIGKSCSTREFLPREFLLLYVKLAHNLCNFRGLLTSNAFVFNGRSLLMMLTIEVPTIEVDLPFDTSLTA